MCLKEYPGQQKKNLEMLSWPLQVLQVFDINGLVKI
jgi:hypothetical protein